MNWLFGLLGVCVLVAFVWGWSKMPQILKGWTDDKEKDNN